jgi:signal peptidase I
MTSDRAAQSPAGGQPLRETAETIAVAVILYLLMSFEAEGFVIPTGSMDPSLMGRHKEVVCPECGETYRVNASTEMEPSVISQGRPESRWIALGTCGNCRCPARIDSQPSFRGDRIAAMKPPLDWPSLPGAGGPQRWDSIVFKYPVQPETRYIKRTISTGGEVVKIEGGDLFAKPIASPEPYGILRKPIEHQRAMLHLVWDDRHRPKSLASDPAWARWSPRKGGDWAEPEPGRFVSGPAGDLDSILAYRHLVPDPEQWQAILTKSPLPRSARPSLITDFDPFNSELSLDDSKNPLRADKPWMLQHWVGDLWLEFDLKVLKSQGSFEIELNEGTSRHAIALNFGPDAGPQPTATASIDGGASIQSAPLPAVTDRTWHVVVANIDDRIVFEINGYPIFPAEVLDFEHRPGPPTEGDLSPIALKARNQAEVEVSGLVLKRDIYYTRQPARVDYDWLRLDPPAGAVGMMEILSDPAWFPRLGEYGSREFPVGHGNLFMLGDNSLWSSDSRAWEATAWEEAAGLAGRRRPWEVPESLVIGKAFWIYWPHAKPIWPEIPLTRDFVVPFRPYFERMTWVR